MFKYSFRLLREMREKSQSTASMFKQRFREWLLAMNTVDNLSSDIKDRYNISFDKSAAVVTNSPEMTRKLLLFWFFLRQHPLI